MIPYRGDVPIYRFPWLTLVLIVANVAVFAYQLTLGPTELLELVDTWGAVPAQITGSMSEQPWAVWSWMAPSITSMFIHGGLWHLALNMLILWAFGEAVENGIGRGKYFFIYMLAGLGAVLAQTLFIPGSEIPMIGASGAIAGVMGMYILMYPLSDMKFYFPPFFVFKISAMVLVFAWFFYQIMAGVTVGPVQALVGGVAWWAHVGGFVIGVATHLLIAREAVHWSDEQPHQRGG